MGRINAGFREIEHTADWELEVWAPDLKQLFIQAAMGMYALAGAKMKDNPRQICLFNLQAMDRESLLVEFLSELLYYYEQMGFGFIKFNLSIQDYELKAECVVVPLISIKKEIKAVTFHEMNIQDIQNGLRVRIVFDV